MAKEKVQILIQGGKATAAPPLGPALGPMGVNIGQVVAAINEKTKSFAGMQVPVTVEIDSKTKAFEISIGTPPASGLIKKEAGIQKGASNPKEDSVSDIAIEQVIKIAKMKEDVLLGKDLKQKVKEICGTCNSLGVLIEGKKGAETIKDINSGKFDKEILSGKTDISKEEKQKLDEEKKKLQEESKAHHADYVTKAKELMAKNSKLQNKQMRKMLSEAEIPGDIINEVAPEEKEK